MTVNVVNKHMEGGYPGFPTQAPKFPTWNFGKRDFTYIFPNPRTCATTTTNLFESF